MARNLRQTQSKDLLFVSVVILSPARSGRQRACPERSRRNLFFRPHPLFCHPERSTRSVRSRRACPERSRRNLLSRQYPLRRHPERSTRSVRSRSACPERSRRNLLFRSHPLRCHPERITRSVRSRRTCFSAHTPYVVILSGAREAYAVEGSASLTRSAPTKGALFFLPDLNGMASPES